MRLWVAALLWLLSFSWLFNASYINIVLHTSDIICKMCFMCHFIPITKTSSICHYLRAEYILRFSSSASCMLAIYNLFGNNTLGSTSHFNKKPYLHNTLQEYQQSAWTCPLSCHVTTRAAVT